MLPDLAHHRAARVSDLHWSRAADGGAQPLEPCRSGVSLSAPHTKGRRGMGEPRTRRLPVRLVKSSVG